MSRLNTSTIALPPLQPIASKNATIKTTSPRQASLPSTKLTPKHVLSTSQRWHHLTTRTPSATPFIYAVITTKIYCLPTCPSRLARRANVIFFSTPKAAARGGFRACKRCKPDLSPSFLSTENQNPSLPAHATNSSDPSSSNTEQNSTASASLDSNTTTPNTPITNPTASLPNDLTSHPLPFDQTDPSLKLHLAIRLIQHSSLLNQKLSLTQLSHAVGLSKWHLQRAFKKRTGKSPREMNEELLAEHKTPQKAQTHRGYDSSSSNTSRDHDAATFPRADAGMSEPSGLMPVDPVLAAVCNAHSNVNFNTETNTDLDTDMDMNVDMDMNINFNSALNLDLDLDMNMNMNFSDLNSDPEMNWNLRDSSPTGSSFPGFSAGERLTESNTSASTGAPTPTPISGHMNDTTDFDSAWSTEAFSPEWEGMLRDLFPEIYDEGMLFKDGGMVVSK